MSGKLSTSATTAFSGTATVMFWTKDSNASSGTRNYVAKYSPLGYYINQTNTPGYDFRIYNGGFNNLDMGYPTDGTWWHGAVSVSSTGSENTEIYYNGGTSAADTATVSSLDNASAPLVIGELVPAWTGAGGKWDQVVILDAPLHGTGAKTNWHAAHYNNTDDPGAFAISQTAEEVGGGGGGVTNYFYTRLMSMSGFEKNKSSQKWMVFAFDRTDNTPKTGDAANITAKLSKDYGTLTAVGDTNPTELEDGYYLFDLTQAETNADVLHIFPESSTSDIQVIGCPATVFTVPLAFNTLLIDGAGRVASNLQQWKGTAPLDLDSQKVQTHAVTLADDSITDDTWNTDAKQELKNQAKAGMADYGLDHLVAVAGYRFGCHEQLHHRQACEQISDSGLGMTL